MAAYIVENLEERAAHVLTLAAERLKASDKRFEVRSAARHRYRVPTVAFCGHSRAGKDFGAKYFCRELGLGYPGSASWFALPFVARLAGVVPDRAWNDRHQHRAFWFAACNALRVVRPALLVQMALAAGDVVAGIRSALELDAARDVITLRVWIDNSRVPPDPTLEYGPDDCDVVLANHGSHSNYFERLRALAALTGGPWNAAEVFGRRQAHTVMYGATH